MSEWQPREDLEPIPMQFDLGNHKILDDGKLRFEFIIYTAEGDITIRGFRYDPDTDEILFPSYRAGNGYQPYIKIEGPLLDELHERIQQLALDLAETEQVSD